MSPPRAGGFTARRKAQACFELGRRLLRLGPNRQAKTWLERALDFGSRDPRVHTLLGHVESVKSRTAAEERYLRAAREGEQRGKRAAFAARAGLPGRAAADCRAALAIGPSSEAEQLLRSLQEAR